MLSNAEKVTVYGNEGPTDSTVGGWRLLLALVGWITLAVGTGVASWNALAPGWGGIDGRVLVILAEVYLALVMALLLAFGGPAGLRDRLRFQYTSSGDLRLALGVWILCWAAITLTYLALSPVLGPPQDAMLPLLRFGSDMSRLPPPVRSCSASSWLGRACWHPSRRSCSLEERCSAGCAATCLPASPSYLRRRSSPASIGCPCYFPSPSYSASPRAGCGSGPAPRCPSLPFTS